MDNDPPDFELIVRVLAGDDRSAFGQLVKRHQSAVRNFLRQLTRGDVATADDLAQETFLRAYRQLRQYRPEARFSTWLLGIAHNLQRNDARARARFVTLPPEADPPDDRASVDAAFALKEDLGQALRCLSPEEQLAIHLAYHQGLSHSEITDVTRWPLGTVKTHLARAKDQLRIHLRQWDPQQT